MTTRREFLLGAMALGACRRAPPVIAATALPDALTLRWNLARGDTLVYDVTVTSVLEDRSHSDTRRWVWRVDEVDAEGRCSLLGVGDDTRVALTLRPDGRLDAVTDLPFAHAVVQRCLALALPRRAVLRGDAWSDAQIVRPFIDLAAAGTVESVRSDATLVEASRSSRGTFAHVLTDAAIAIGGRDQIVLQGMTTFDLARGRLEERDLEAVAHGERLRIHMQSVA